MHGWTTNHRRDDCEGAEAGSWRRHRADHVERRLIAGPLIDALLRPPLKNRDAVRLITHALSSGDFMVTPDFGFAQVFLDPPKSLHVVDMAVTTLNGTIASTDIRLRLMPSDD